MTKLHAEIEDLRAELPDLDKQAKEARAKHREYHEKYLGFDSIMKDLESCQVQQSWLQNDVNNLTASLKRREESDDWLQTEIDQYEARMKAHSERRTKQGEVYGSLRQKLEAVRTNLQFKHTEAGKHEQQKATYEQQIEERKTVIWNAARSHHIHGFESNLDEARSQEFMTRLSKLLKDQTILVESSPR